MTRYQKFLRDFLVQQEMLWHSTCLKPTMVKMIVFLAKNWQRIFLKMLFFFKMLMIAWLHVNKKVMFKSNVLFLCLQVTEYVPRFSVIHSVLNYKCLHLDS